MDEEGKALMRAAQVKIQSSSTMVATLLHLLHFPCPRRVWHLANGEENPGGAREQNRDHRRYPVWHSTRVGAEWGEAC